MIDTGKGISPDEHAAIFEPFQQSRKGTRAEGTGLGLTIARRYVQMMGGELELESEVNKGSRFFFTLPLSRASGQVFAEGSEKQVAALSPDDAVVALVVDDLAENRQILSHMLRSVGVSVHLAEDGREAVEAVQAVEPDIVFMDIRMPVLDGMEAARLICAQEDEDKPVLIAVSASALAHERAEILEAGFDDFIAKPVQEGRIFLCMAERLGVQYVYREALASSLNLGAVALPAHLCERLWQAAELGQVTELDRLLSEVRNLDEAMGPFADHLDELCRRLDLKGIRELLEEVRQEG